MNIAEILTKLEIEFTRKQNTVGLEHVAGIRDWCAEKTLTDKQVKWLDQQCTWYLKKSYDDMLNMNEVVIGTGTHNVASDVNRSFINANKVKVAVDVEVIDALIDTLVQIKRKTQ